MRSVFLLLAILLGFAWPAPGAAPATNPEISRLLHFVETANVRFIRNGKEYSAQEGADHLRDKLSKAGDRVKSAEDFINGVASSSYLSGKPYLVKFPDGHTAPTNGWLMEELSRDRRPNR